MATWSLKSNVGEKFNKKPVEQVAITPDGRKYLKRLHKDPHMNVTLTDEVLAFMEYQDGYDAALSDVGRQCLKELEEILEALEANTNHSNKRMAESGLSIIDDIKNRIYP